MRAPGRPLEPKVRGFMEARFGHDFGRVRVHTDDRAATSARALNAKAYTVGNHVVFAAGRFAPHSTAGRRLRLRLRELGAEFVGESDSAVGDAEEKQRIRQTMTLTNLVGHTIDCGMNFICGDPAVVRHEERF